MVRDLVHRQDAGRHGKPDLHGSALQHAHADVRGRPGRYPARVEFTPALENRNRLTVALRIIWAIPALVVTIIISIIGFVCWLIGAIVVLFTGTWPGGLRDWVLKAIRAGLRLNSYMYLLTDEYPPMSFE
jgi:hypothetical protein